MPESAARNNAGILPFDSASLTKDSICALGIGDRIWEIRSRLKDMIARTLFSDIDQGIVLLHGFVKKSQKTPKEDIELAKKRRKQYLAT
jgi:phage-related protein